MPILGAGLRKELAKALDPGMVVLAIPSSNIQVRITNSNYQRLAP